MLNIRIIIRTLGRLLIIEGIFMLLALLVALCYQENDVLSFVYSASITIGIGLIAYFTTIGVNKDIGKKEGFIIVTLVWIVCSFFGTLPYILSGSIPNLTDAFFETMSGFTTTGSSILNNIETLPHGILFWRSLTQWIGGLGIILLGISIMPVFSFGGMQLFTTEIPGHITDKLSSKVLPAIKNLWVIYVSFTVAETMLLWIGGMNLFDAVNHSFTTMATGGFSTKQIGLAYWSSPFIEYVITFFMIIAGMNFIVSYFLLSGKFSKANKNEEFRYYLIFIGFFTLLIFTGLLFTKQLGIETAFRNAIFQVVSIITTTGFTTVNYMLWSPFLIMILFVLFFFGGSTGSTSGGLKTMRVVILLKNSYYEFYRIIHPNAVIPIRFNTQVVPEKITGNVLAFFMSYLIIFFVSTVILMLVVPNLTSAMGLVASCLGNIGTGLGGFVSAGSFSSIHPVGKWFLSILMLLGRLELFTLMILLSPSFWKN